MPEFDPSSLPDLTGRVYLVTGGNAGIGLETVRFLALKNATVYMGCRSPAKGNASIASIKAAYPNAKINLLILDHMKMSSVVSAAKELITKEKKLHGLINNAGIMAVPFEKSQDGYESQWQTNCKYWGRICENPFPLPRCLMILCRDNGFENNID